MKEKEQESMKEGSKEKVTQVEDQGRDIVLNSK